MLTIPELTATTPGADRGMIARGAGRSYGDAAQNAGGVVVDTTAGAHVGVPDAGGVVSVSAGATIADLLHELVPQGWFVPVTPGTRAVTMGGAVAADIHGKNHHRDGSIGAHVCALALRTPDGSLHELGPDCDPAAFWATVGGMGLTGVIERVDLRLRPIRSAGMLVDTDRTGDLDETMAALVDAEGRHPYAVAWVDTLAAGRRLGRGVVTAGDHAGGRLDHEPPPAPNPRISVPPAVPRGLLGPAVAQAFNLAWWRAAPRRSRDQPQSIGRFFHPLDGVSHWNRLYGPAGFVQHQFVVPDGAEGLVRSVLERAAAAGIPSFLTVLKRMGPRNPAPLSFPLSGWTLCMDIPAATPELGRHLDDVDEDVAAAGGRIYLAKDACVRPELIPQMYPELETWREVRDRLDPDRRMSSDLARRLDLIGGG